MFILYTWKGKNGVDSVRFCSTPEVKRKANIYLLWSMGYSCEGRMHSFSEQWVISEGCGMYRHVVRCRPALTAMSEADGWEESRELKVNLSVGTGSAKEAGGGFHVISLSTRRTSFESSTYSLPGDVSEMYACLRPNLCINYTLVWRNCCASVL